jgi:hypothetical protein
MTPDYLPKTWIKSVATECGISCETIEQLLDFAERVQRAAWLAASIPAAQAAPSEPVERYNCTTGGMEPHPQGDWIAFAAPPPPAAPAVAQLAEAINALDHSLDNNVPYTSGTIVYELMQAVKEAVRPLLLAAAPAVAVEPNGWAMVPRDPTPEMIDAASLSVNDNPERGWESRVYRAMLAAAAPRMSADGGKDIPFTAQAEPLTPKQQETNEWLRFCLENIRLFAARHRKEAWAATVLGFCTDAKVTGSPFRAAPAQPAPQRQEDPK